MDASVSTLTPAQDAIRSRAERIVAAHDRFDRAVGNVRNAVAMPGDDPSQARGIIPNAVEAYDEALLQLDEVQAEARQHAPVRAPGAEEPADGDPPTPPAPPVEEPPAPPREAAPPNSSGTREYPEPFEVGQTAYIVVDGYGNGTIEARGDLKDGIVALRLATDTHFRDQDYPAEDAIGVPVDCLSLDAPAAPPAAA